MSRLARVVLGAVLCLGMAGFASAAEEAPVSVGDFAVQLAKMVTEKEYTPEGAVAILSEIGVKLDARLGDRLTEAELVNAFNQLGFEWTTSKPGQLVSAKKARTAVSLFTESGPRECPPGFPGASCNAVKCASGVNEGTKCSSDAECPGSFCRIPPGLAKKVPSPSDG